MGAYAPAPFLNEAMKNIIIDNIIKPTIRGMQKEGSPYTGVLYIGLMLTASGPTVIEYNVRLGDPEAQVVLPLIKTDFVDIMSACLNSYLASLKLEYYSGYCAGVVMASGGYPGKYVTNIEIIGDLGDTEESFVFHAGTKKLLDGTLVTDGGRVLCVSAIGVTLKEAIDRAYSRVNKIYFEGASFRRDIGARGLKHFEPK
jgi:phosphoribosylamine--glycine ligase